MNSAVAAIFGDFQVQSWASRPYERSLELATSHPEAVLDFARTAIERLPDNITFYQDTVSWLPDSDWPALITFALDILERNPKNEAAAFAVAAASLQALPALHPHLEHLFHLEPNEETYYSSWPWRESGASHLAFLRRMLDHPPTVPDVDYFAFQCLLEMRSPEALAEAVGRSRQVLGPRYPDAPAMAEAFFQTVGFTISGGAPRQLYPEYVRHLSFPAEYLPDPGPFWLQRHHPTWNLEPDDAPALRFGGSQGGHCAICGAGLCHALTLEGMLPELGITGLPRLSLAFCLLCLESGGSVLYFRHDEAGQPSSLGEARDLERLGDCRPLLPAQVWLTGGSSRWRWQDWGLSNGRQNLHRVGGFPCWVQSADYPECPNCGALMSFLFQLDSKLSAEGGDQVLWGSGGLAYFHWCDACRISACLIQYT